MLCSLQVFKRREADVRKLGAVLIVSIAVTIADSPHPALAKGDKSTTSLFKHTVTGKHYNNTILTPHKPKAPVTEQKPAEKSGNTDKGPNNNPNSTGAGASRGPNDNPNSTGAGASRGPNNNPNSTGVGASSGPKPTLDKVGVKNISR
jgi:hypothetical protein